MFSKSKFNSYIIRKLRIILCLLLISSSFSVAIARPIAQEYQIKAVFLYNFANFIRWPDSVFSFDAAPFNICILGEDPFQTAIDLTVEGEQVNSHPVKIKRIANIYNIQICHILFISKSEEDYLNNILYEIKTYPILTVSDIDSFINQGGMIQFFKHRKRVRFYIAPNVLKQVALQANANLLRIAKIIE
ncbi:MAG: YfiR family protein [Thiomargarita sp.]|nr:YfiR family protein [Thiomargarita sp.]